MSRAVVRDYVSRTSALAQGTAVVGVVSELQGVPLVEFDQLYVRLRTSQQANSAGAGTLDFYLQRGVTGQQEPASATDGDWEDFAHFGQLAKLTSMDKVMTLPLPLAQDVDASLASISRTVAQASLAADTLLGGHWGNAIRIAEKVGAADLTQAAIYTVEFVGIRLVR